MTFSYRRMIKREPDIAAARAEMAALYRRIRKTDHNIARLLHRRMANATAKMIDALFYQRVAQPRITIASLFLED